MKKYSTVGLTFAMAIGGMAFWAWTNALLMPEVVHTADDIAAAHRLFQIVPTLSLALAVVGVALTAFSWRKHAGRAYRVVSLLPLIALVAGAVMARGTIVELLMFSPLDEARFATVADADFLEPEHLVLGVSIGGEAKAYPVGMMNYHHIVNDRLAGEPYVATY